jgi:hypothetical protein
MMRRTIDSLTPQEKELLVDLYDSDKYKALCKLIEAERLELAKDCLTIPADRLSYVQGQAHGLRALCLEMKTLHKESQKKG